MQFPILYKQTSTGKIQMWKVETNGDQIISTYGQLDGKQQTAVDVAKAKNIGKSNETTPEEQANLQAEQDWNKKLKRGYTENLKLAISTDNVLEAVSPMLAFPIEKKEKYVVFPAFLQPKLDGVRCIAVIVDGVCNLFSRTQKPITTLPHIIKALEKLYADMTITLDGELYSHEHKDDFNRIMSLIKRDEIHPDCHEVQYHIYDVVMDLPFKERLSYITQPNTDYIKYVPTIIVNDRDAMDEAFSNYLVDGYEGAMYRNMDSTYETKRSAGLLKVKTMQDDEFEIIGVNEGNGKLIGHAGSFICKTQDGNTFSAKLKGNLDDLKEKFDNFENYRGKMMTVQYQGFTPDGSLRFPVGLRIRIEE